MANLPVEMDSPEPGRSQETPGPVLRGQTTMARLSRLEATRDRGFDRDFWAARTPAERFQAAWQLVVDYQAIRGEADEPRLRRSVAELRPLRG